MPATAAPAAPPPSSPAPTQSPSPATAGAPPAQGAPPSAPEGPPKSTGFSEPFAEIERLAGLDKIIADTQQKSPPPPGARRPPAQTAKEPEKAVAAEQAKQQAGETQKAPEKPVELPDDVDYTKVKLPQLVSAHKNLKKEARETREKLAAAQLRLDELEAKAAELEQVPKWQEQLTAAEKRAQELEEAIRFADYEKSPEYKEKYYQPFVDAYSAARNKVGSLKVQEIKNDVDEVVQPGRRATPEDFDAIMRIADDGEAAELAARMFGPMANLVIYHREKVMDLNGARSKAIEDYRKQGSEREQQTMAQRQQMFERVKGTFHKLVQDGVAKYPQWFKADDADDAGKKALEQGFANADSMFAPSNEPPEAQAAKHAAFRNMAGAFPYLALKLHRTEAKVKELETELEQFKKSEPNEPGRDREKPEVPLTVEAEIDQLAATGPRR